MPDFYKEALRGFDFDKNSLFLCSEDYMKSVFLFSLLSLKKLVSVEFMSVYRLLDIFLGHDKVYDTILDVQNSIIVVS